MQASFSDALKFDRNPMNRAINRGHVQKLKKAWLESAELMPPVTVNYQTMHIIDGQHRIEAFKELVRSGQLPNDAVIDVKCVDVPYEKELEAIIKANTNSKNWIVEDFIESYTMLGLDTYIKLKEWCQCHQLTNCNGKPKYIYGAAMITGKECRKMLCNGDFNCTDEEFEQGDKVHAEITEIASILGLKSSNSWITSLAISWWEVRNWHPFEEWVRELKTKMRSATFQDLPKQSKSQFDNIFNTIHASIDKKKAA